MVIFYKNTLTILLLCVLCFLAAGCESPGARVGLEWLDHKLSGFVEQMEKDLGDPEFAAGPEESGDEEPGEEEVTPPDPDELDREARSAIDAWLEENNFNRFGDPVDTYYTGGTPLFNEATGATIERFEYIISKHPDILEKVFD